MCVNVWDVEEQGGLLQPVKEPAPLGLLGAHWDTVKMGW